MEQPISNFLSKLGGLRFELKNILDSMEDYDDATNGKLNQTLAQLDLVLLTVGKIQSQLRGHRKALWPLQEGGQISSIFSAANRQRAVDVYLDLLCTEIPQICPEWIIYSRSAAKIKMYQVVCYVGDVNPDLRNCVLVEFLPETDESSAKIALKYKSVRGGIDKTNEDEIHRFEFTPENFLESFVGVLKMPLDVKYDVKVESPVDDSGIGASPEVANQEDGTDGVAPMTTSAAASIKARNKGNSSTKQRGPRKRQKAESALDVSRLNSMKYEDLDESSNHADVSTTIEETSGNGESKLPPTKRPSRSASAFVHYSEIMDDDDDDDNDDDDDDEDDYLPSGELIEAEDFIGDDEIQRYLEETGKKRKKETVGVNGLVGKLGAEELSIEEDVIAGVGDVDKQRNFGNDDPVESGAVENISDMNPEDELTSKARPRNLKPKSDRKRDKRSAARQRKPQDDGKDFDGNPLDCSLCGKKVKTSYATLHMAKCHDKRGFQCCYCLKEYPNAEDFRKHIRTTHGKKQSKKLLPCKDCSLLVNEGECVEHNRIEHQKPLECPFCDYGSESKDPSELNVRLLLQQSLTTSSPGQKLKRHVFNDHFNLVFKQFRCPYCQTSFKTQEMMDEHTNRDLDPAERTVRLCAKMRAEGEKEEKAICAHCGQSFGITYIKIHIQRIHEKSLPFNYKCQFCPKRYEHPKRLRAHLLQFHFPEKKDIACNLCPKKFASHRMLAQHIKTHSAPAVECPKCDKGESRFALPYAVVS